MRNRIRAWDVLFYILLAGYTVLMCFLFYRQACEYQGIYYSDMKPYIQHVQGIEGVYSFPYPILFWLTGLFAAVCSWEMAIALAVALLNSLSVVLVRYYAGQLLEEADWNRQVRRVLEWVLAVLVFAPFFISMIYSPRGVAFLGFDYTYRCMGIYTPNPYWNATYLATRPFSILCFFQGVRLLRHYEERFSRREGVLFGISLLLTTMTKPSFTFVVVPVMGIIMLWRLAACRFRTLRSTIYLGLCFLPTGAVLLYQYFGVFTGENAQGEQTGIGILPGAVWHLYSNNIPLSIFMGLAFPLFMLLMNLRECRKNSLWRFAWQLLAAGLLSFYFLYEKGFRMEHANFSWGYMHGMFFVCLVGIFLMVKNTVEWRKSWKAVFLPAEYAAFLLHMVCGINYFIYVLQGNNTGWF